MQRAAQAPQPAFPKIRFWAWELESIGSQHSIWVLSSIFKSLKSKYFNNFLLLIFPLAHLQPLHTAFRGVQRYCLLSDNPMLPTKGMMDNGSEYIPKSNLMHKVLHLTPPNYCFALKNNTAPTLTTHPNPPHPAKQNPKTKQSRYFGCRLFRRKNKLHS